MSEPTAPANSARQRRKQARPQELLQAALELFVEKGFAATRTDDVALRAGVSKGTLYLYFPSKEELFKAVVRTHLSALIAQAQAQVQSYQGDTAALLRQLMLSFWESLGNTQAGGICKVVMAEVRNFPELAQFYADEVITPAHALVGQTLQRGILRGEFRALPLEEATHAIIAPLIFMALSKHSFGACPIKGVVCDPMRALEVNFDLFLHGLAAPAASSRARKP